MAHTGSFTPARRSPDRADRPHLYPLGASDNLTGGESTFMVEMNETAKHYQQHHPTQPDPAG